MEIRPIKGLLTAGTQEVASPEVIAKNVQRWNAQQAAAAKKKEAAYGGLIGKLREKLGREPKHWEIIKAQKAARAAVAEEKKAKFLLKNCRATLSEIIQAHPPKQAE